MFFSQQQRKIGKKKHKLGCIIILMGCISYFVKKARWVPLPYLNYGLIVWGQARKSYLNKLLKLQKRALRFIYFSDRNQHAIPLFSDAGILPLQFSYYELTAT